jgi:2-oxoisovalerate dehydrogenase E1 component beta subunit
MNLNWYGKLAVRTSPKAIHIVEYLRKWNLVQRRQSTIAEPPPAGGHLPSIATSKILRATRDSAIRTPGIKWIDDEDNTPPKDMVGGRETRKMNTYQAVRDAMRYVRLHTRFLISSPYIYPSIALTKDDNAIIFGEDVAFGGVFRCTMVRSQYFSVNFRPVIHLQENRDSLKSSVSQSLAEYLIFH